MKREVAVRGATVLALLHLACAAGWAQSSTPISLAPPAGTASSAPKPAPVRAAKAPKPAHEAHGAKRTQTARASASHRVQVARARKSGPKHVPVITTASLRADPAPSTELTDQERWVGDLAIRNGEKTFLMVDKAMGKVMLFQDGKPIYSGPALTGQSRADDLPAGALGETFDQLSSQADKITPAGRFTVRRGKNQEYGSLLDVNEIHGKDWGIAIHQVWLGDPSEQRAARLRSRNEEDRHITFGCINVTPEAMRLFEKEVPEDQPTPLYILPYDGNRLAEYFTQRNS